ncbi:MAG TPA: tetratricopeptide repeat protein, partial [Rhizomicrobium sp.]|nr:tetratricopeptide repeat protein [Rhizomicrobium sp.]
MTIFVPKYMSVTCTADLCKCLAASQEGYETLAVQFCTNVIETGDAKYRVTAYLIRARANILKRDYDHAIVDATQAIATKSDIPDDLPAAYILRGQTYEEMGNFDKALADYDAALGVDANTFGAYAWRSSVYVLTGKYDLALADDAMGLKLKPDFEGSYLDRGYDYFAQGRFADAASDFEKARSLNPPDPVAVLWLHLANLHQGTDDGVQFAANSAKVKLDEWPGQTV